MEYLSDAEVGGDEDSLTSSEPDGITLGSQDTISEYGVDFGVNLPSTPVVSSTPATTVTDASFNGGKYRNWCFTLWFEDNDPAWESDVKIGFFKSLVDSKQVRYIVVGRELGTVTERKHYQGCVMFDSQRTLGGIKKLFKEPTMHLEVCRALIPAINYCKKDNNFVEFGVGPDTASRKRGSEKGGEKTKEKWDKILKLAINQNYNAIADVDPGCVIRCANGLKFAASLKKPEPVPQPRNWVWDNMWIMGKSGSGKTWEAWCLAGRFDRETGDQLEGWEDRCYSKSPTGKWFDLYNQQPTIVIDDVSTETLKMWPDFRGQILRIADVYGDNVEIKGGTMRIHPKRVNITSNFCPWEIFPNNKDLEPVLRRFSVMYKWDRDIPGSVIWRADGQSLREPVDTVVAKMRSRILDIDGASALLHGTSTTFHAPPHTPPSTPVVAREPPRTTSTIKLDAQLTLEEEEEEFINEWGKRFGPVDLQRQNCDVGRRE